MPGSKRKRDGEEGSESGALKSPRPSRPGTLQCVAVCSVVQFAVCISVFGALKSPRPCGPGILQCVAVCCSVLQCVSQCVSQCVAVCCSMWQCVAKCGSVLQYIAACNRTRSYM